jgi:hypothetical protein
VTSHLAVFVMAVSRERGADEVLLAVGGGWVVVGLAVKARGIPALPDSRQKVYSLQGFPN